MEPIKKMLNEEKTSEFGVIFKKSYDLVMNRGEVQLGTGGQAIDRMLKESLEVPEHIKIAEKKESKLPVHQFNPKINRANMRQQAQWNSMKKDRDLPYDLPETNDNYEYGNGGEVQIKPENAIDAAEYQMGREGEGPVLGRDMEPKNRIHQMRKESQWSQFNGVEVPVDLDDAIEMKNIPALNGHINSVYSKIKEMQKNIPYSESNPAEMNKLKDSLGNHNRYLEALKRVRGKMVGFTKMNKSNKPFYTSYGKAGGGEIGKLARFPSKKKFDPDKNVERTSSEYQEKLGHSKEGADREAQAYHAKYEPETKSLIKSIDNMINILSKAEVHDYGQKNPAFSNKKPTQKNLEIKKRK